MEVNYKLHPETKQENGKYKATIKGTIVEVMTPEIVTLVDSFEEGDPLTQPENKLVNLKILYDGEDIGYETSVSHNSMAKERSWKEYGDGASY